MKDNKDLYDKIFYKIGVFFVEFNKKEYQKEWFEWVEWVTLTAAMWAIAEKTGSVLVRIIAIVSVAMVFFKAWLTVEQFAENWLPNPSKLPKWLVFLLSILISLVPIFIMHLLAEVFGALIS